MKSLRLICRQSDRYIFDAITRGSKTVDTRAGTPKYRSLAVGDRLTFACGADTITKVVSKAEHYESIESMLTEVPLQSILPEAASHRDLEAMYDSFPGYRDKIEQFGIMALWLGQ